MKVLLIKILHFLAKIYWQLFKPITIGVRCIVKNQGNEILLIKNYYSFDKEKWRLPGGGVKKDENPEKAVLREIKEETGYGLKDLKFRGIFYNEFEGKRDYIFLYDGQSSGELTNNSSEIAQIKFWPINDLPKVTPGTSRRLKEYFDHTNTLEKVKE